MSSRLNGFGTSVGTFLCRLSERAVLSNRELRVFLSDVGPSTLFLILAAFVVVHLRAPPPTNANNEDSWMFVTVVMNHYKPEEANQV